MFIKRGMEKEAVVHIYNGILLSYKRKEIGLFVETWMDLETRESYRVKYMTERLHFYFSLSCTGEQKWQPTPVFLPGESQGRRSLVGCHLWGRTESDMTEVT